MNTGHATSPLQLPHCPPKDCRLVILTGPGAGQCHVLASGRSVIGRAGDADLEVPSMHLSRRHFELQVDEHGITLVDLDSTNGIAVNGSWVRKAEVRPGAIIEAGDVRFALLPPVESDGELPALDRLGGLIGASPVMRRLYERILRAATSDATVLVRGESGAGKEAVAAALHDLSPRSTHPLMVCDLASVSGGTIDSDLFGHVRGAFTGATRDTPGILRSAQGGSVLLDEVGELPADMQSKLLRVVERREVRPVGAVDAIRIDARLIATTLRPLERMVTAGTFRLDLLHRLSVISMTVPPLRERLDDLALLTSHLVRELAPDEVWEVSDEAIALLGAYAWPGNVRELRNVLQRVLAQAAPPTLGMGELVRYGGLQGPGEDVEPGWLPFHVAKELVNDRWERAYLLQLVQGAGGNLSRAATLAGISRVHLYRLLRKHRMSGR